MHKIIVVEDNQMLLENIEIILEAEGFKVFTADCGKTGLKLIEEIIPDVIISDIMLPDMDGFEILKTVRRNPEVHDLPFLFLTARTDHKDLRLGMSLGADDYLTKPFNAAELIEAIRTRLELIELRKSAPGIKGSGNVKGSGNGKASGNGNGMNTPDTVFVRDAKGIANLAVKDIVCIKALGEYTEVVTPGGRNYTVKKLLKDWESVLPAASFIRVHRSAIINIHHIVKIQEWFNHSLRIYMNNTPEPLVSSRRYTARIKEMYFI